MRKARCFLIEMLRGSPVDVLGTVHTAHLLAVVLLFGSLYGASLGIWNSWQQAVYAAIKFPALILLTVFCNSAINAMLAKLLGLPLPALHSSKVILMSFAIACIVLASLAPVFLFLAAAVPLQNSGDSIVGHSCVLCVHVAAIALSGVIGNVRLFSLLARLIGDRQIARRILLLWLALNLFAGCQISWILRPFIGAPFLPVQFLRPNAFEGNFYEILFQSLNRLGG